MDPKFGLLTGLMAMTSLFSCEWSFCLNCNFATLKTNRKFYEGAGLGYVPRAVGTLCSNWPLEGAIRGHGKKGRRLSAMTEIPSAVLPFTAAVMSR